MPSGRPKKSENIIEYLDAFTVYNPSTIAAFALKNGLVSTKEDGKRVRNAMQNLTKHHSFHRLGDGFIYRRGQAPIPGWYGMRWLILRTEKEGTE